MADGIKKIQEGLGKKVTSGYVIYPGEYELPLIKNVTTLPLELL
jgi:hypothetical protein